MRLSLCSLILPSLTLPLLASTASADPVIVFGNTAPSGLNSSNAVDRGIQEDTICQAIRGSEALGNTLLLLTPAVVCDGKRYEGECGGRTCTKDQIAAKITAFAKTLPANRPQNLLLQSVGHGNPDLNRSSFSEGGPETNQLGISGNINGQDLADILNRSGILTKVKTARGLWTQCYSGGWNELARLIRPQGKFCAMAASPSNQPATVSEKEWEVLKGSAFVNGFWNTQVKTGGKAGLQESTVEASLHKLGSTGAHAGYLWTSSSRHLLERETKTGSFYPRQSNDDYASEPPKGYFSSGYDFYDIKAMIAFQEGTTKAADRASLIQDRYKEKVEAVAEYNADKWFFQDAKPMPGSSLITYAACTQPVREPMDEANREFVKALEQIRNRVQSSTYAAQRKKMEAMLDAWKAEHQQAAKNFPAEVKQYHLRMNELLSKSGALMRKLRTPGLSYPERKEASEEYRKLESQIYAIKRLDDFPSLRRMLAIEKSAQHLDRMIQLIDDQQVDPATRKLILDTWECENGPVFLNTQRGDA